MPRTRKEGQFNLMGCQQVGIRASSGGGSGDIEDFDEFAITTPIPIENYAAQKTEL